jgi:hypothetical protein
VGIVRISELRVIELYAVDMVDIVDNVDNMVNVEISEEGWQRDQLEVS